MQDARWLFFDLGNTLISEERAWERRIQRLVSSLERYGRSRATEEVAAALREASAEFAPRLITRVALAAASVQAAPIPTSRHAKGHETPAQNVRNSQQYDYLVSTNAGFRAARMKTECGPIRDPGLRSSCLASFSEYEPR